jgi:archaellum component FlaG (FlaF/FlaG flagellin family)
MNVLLTLYLFNDGDQKITTNPSDWNLIADGLKYEYRSTPFDS